MIVSDLIYAAMRIAGILRAPGRQSGASGIADGVLCLNSMLDSWQTERLLVYAEIGHTYPVVANQQQYFIGVDGTPDITIRRPEKIDRAGLIYTNFSPPTEVAFTMLNAQQWAAVTPKSLQSTIPTHMYYEPRIPNGLIWLWPIPTSTWSMMLYLWENLSTVDDEASTIILPPGYQAAIEYNLALELAARYPERAKLPSWAVARAALTKQNIKTMNDEGLLMQAESGALGIDCGPQGRFNLFSNTHFGS